MSIELLYLLNITMSVNYQSLLGDTSINADAIVTQELDAVVANIVDLNVTEKAIMNQVSVVSLDTGTFTTGFLKMTTGAALDTVLTCITPSGTSAWRPPAAITLVGDANGAAGGNRVDTLAGGTIAVSNLVTLAGSQSLTNKTLSASYVSFPNSAQNKKLVIYDNGVTTSTSDQRFSGFGISAGTFRISCGDTGSDFVFYAPTSATSSNEVFRIKGNGAANMGGTFTTAGLVSNSFKMNTGVTNGYVLVTDASGVGTWKTRDLTGDITSVGTVTSAGPSIVTLTSTQTLSNKTLTSPIISQILNTGTLTLPNVSTSLIGHDTVNTLTYKTIKGNTNNIDANTIRSGSTWSADFGGVAPVASNILTYDGSNAIWLPPAVVSAGNLTGDITSVGLATTASAIMVKTTSAQTLTNKTLGYTVFTNNIWMNNNYQPKMISLYDSGTSTNQSQHNYNGFGMTGGILRYQVNTTDDHVFYAATSNTTSKELFRLKNGGGAIMVGRLDINTGPTGNIGIGTSALNGNISGTSNTAIGSLAVSTASTASNNTAVGYNAMKLITGSNNTAIGCLALSSSTIATSGNTCMGNNSMVNATGNFNVAIGNNTLMPCTSKYNVGVGSSALSSLTSGQANTAVGLDSFYITTTGNNNVGLGTGSGTIVETSSDITCIGHEANVSADTWSNSTALGSGAIVTASNTVQLGNTSTLNVKTSGSVAFPNADVRKRIVVWDGGNIANLNDHKFNGFGKGPSMNVYQVNQTGDDHVFYAATSASTSNELFRVKGNGSLVIAGNSRLNGIDLYDTQTYGTALGTGVVPLMNIYCSSNGAGYMNFTTSNTGLATNTDVFKNNYVKPYTNAPSITFSPANSQATAQIQYMYIDSQPTYFKFMIQGVTLNASQNYKFYFQIMSRD